MAALRESVTVPRQLPKRPRRPGFALLFGFCVLAGAVPLAGTVAAHDGLDVQIARLSQQIDCG